jgi:hypothetical protein
MCEALLTIHAIADVASCFGDQSCGVRPIRWSLTQLVYRLRRADKRSKKVIS